MQRVRWLGTAEEENMIENIHYEFGKLRGAAWSALRAVDDHLERLRQLKKSTNIDLGGWAKSLEDQCATLRALVPPDLMERKP